LGEIVDPVKAVSPERPRLVSDQGLARTASQHGNEARRSCGVRGRFEERRPRCAGNFADGIAQRLDLVTGGVEQLEAERRLGAVARRVRACVNR